MKQRDFIALFYPELSFLGDYHSHPYTTPIDGIKTELDLERKECYRFSSADFNSVNYQQEIERDYRVGLVVTVYERDEGIPRSSKHIDGNSCTRFQCQNMTIWIKAYVWAGDDYRRKADKMVHLICPNLGFNVG
jgi:hypothetical protein